MLTKSPVCQCRSEAAALGGRDRDGKSWVILFLFVQAMVMSCRCVVCEGPAHCTCEVFCSSLGTLAFIVYYKNHTTTNIESSMFSPCGPDLGELAVANQSQPISIKPSATVFTLSIVPLSVWTYVIAYL